MKARVALVRCDDYAESRAAIERTLALINLPHGLFRGQRVALKVNLMKGARPEEALCTHPEFVRALVRIVREAGGTPLVCDSSGILGFTGEAFEAAGYGTMCREEGVKLVDLDNRSPVKRGNLWLGRDAAEADVLVTVPKLKTHTITRLTCALKNHVGLLVGATKCRMHELAPTPKRLAQAIVDIHAALPCQLAVVDGILGLDGGGTKKGRTARQTNAVIAGTDCVAVDAVAAGLIGLPAGSVGLTAVAAARGLGEADLRRIEVLGDSVEALRQRYEPAGCELKRHRAFAWTLYHVRGHSLRPVVDLARCNGCGDCVKACPVDAIKMVEAGKAGGPRHAEIDRKACIRCYACRAACPEKAILLRCGRLLRRVFKQKAAGLALEGMV